MKILRYILSHGLLIGMIVALVAGFYYRPLLLPVSWNNYLNQQLERIDPRLLSFQTRSSRTEETDESVAYAEPTTAETDTTSATLPSAPVTTPPAVIAVAPSTSFPQQAANDTSGDDSDVSEEPADAIPEIPVETAATHRDDEKREAQRLLFDARTAFAKGDMAAAEQDYLELARSEVDDADAFGELGNVYYAQGKWREAGEAYFEAATRLIEQNQTQQLNYLLRVVQGLAPDKAEKLREKMNR